mgnify:FL=1
MNLVTIATLILTGAFLYYTGVIPSISDAYRTVKDKRIYHAFFFLAGVLVSCQAIYAEEKYTIPYVIDGVLIWSISLAAEFWKKDQGRLHVYFTYSGFAVFGLLCVLQIWPKYGFNSLFVPAAFTTCYFIINVFFNSNKTSWYEIAYIISFMTPLIRKL